MSFTSEDTYYDGHRNEGTGRYSTTHYYRLLNPDTLKSLTFSTEKEAIEWIDNLTVNIEKNKEIDLEIEKIEKNIKQNEQEIEVLQLARFKLIHMKDELNQTKTRMPY